MNAEILIGSVMRAYAPPPDLTVSQWAEAHRRLPAASASKGARWSNATAPYLAGIMDATTEPTARTVVIMGASQTGKSSAIHCTVGYWMEHDPSTVLWIMPSFDDAKRLSRGALADMIRSTPALRAIVRGRKTPRGAEQLAESTLLEKVYPGGSLILAGSGTPNSFAGISARRAIGDDFERFERLEEGAPDVLLTNRVESFYDGLVVFISSPLLVDGLIDAKFKASDQRRYVIQCESCGREDYMTWSNPERFHVVYREKQAATARLACPGCETTHDEAARRRMIAAAAARPDRGWRPTATPLDPTAIGFHLPGMISTLGMVTLERLVQQWILARAGGPMALMSFITTRLAEPWEDRGKKLEPHALALRLEDFGDVEAPAGVVCITCGVDVQIDRFVLQMIGWGLGGESWVIDVREIPGDPTLAEVQTNLLTVLDEKYRHACGLALPILITAIDSGYLPEKVAYQLAFKRPRRIAAIKGVGGKFGEPSILKFDAKPVLTAHAVQPVLLNVDGLKLEVALGLEMVKPEGLEAALPGYMHLNRRRCDENYLAQLCAEHRETKKGRMIWVEDRPDNHGFDTAGYARGALKLLVKMSGARTEDAMLQKMAEQIAAAAALQVAEATRPTEERQRKPQLTPPQPAPRVGRSKYLGG